MKILKIWDSEYPWDVRVEKVSATLIEGGHQVFLVCRNRKNQAAEENLNGLQIRRLPYFHFFSALNNPLSFPAFFNPLWLRTMYMVAKQQQVDALLVRDLPLALGAILVGKLIKKPVVLDMAEPYPEMLRLIWRFQKRKWRNILLRNPWFADIVERATMRWIDHVIVVVDESKERLVSLGVASDRISVITNATVFRNDVQMPVPMEYDADRNSFKMVYLGLLGESRGLQTVIEAMPAIVEQIPGACLYILGSGSAEQLLRNMVQEHKLEQSVFFLGWVENTLATSYIQHADIALIPHYSCGHWDNTIPNKLFDYMSFGVPVVASDVPPMKRIIAQEQCGVLFGSGDAESCAEAVLRLKDQSVRERLGEHGKSAVQKKYSWEHSAGKLIKVFGEL